MRKFVWTCPQCSFGLECESTYGTSALKMDEHIRVDHPAYWQRLKYIRAMSKDG